MSELTRIFKQLAPARQDKVLALARALLAEQEAETAATNPTGASYSRRRGRPRSTKTGTYTEIRTIRNRGNGNAYKWQYEVTYQDGRVVSQKSRGMVAKLG